ncbi:hypothetical protein UZ36_06780 [Candidatus Nitromaritima sp. SCGC AAA799-C22]|nr:hypothetical protein UZ36_06780 [Candidatus Nitromaritima sp. SCGC AAA799-C22]
MTVVSKNKTDRKISRWHRAIKLAPALMLALMFNACATNLQTKVAGNLNQLSKQQTVAILPVEVMEKGQMETAALFRQTLYANLKESNFNLLERYVVDGLLKQNNLIDPSQFLNINPMKFAEILGADAVLISRINKVERSYLIVHSSIEIGVSVQMVDTRTGEILWRAEQTESDFQGIGKIPTGISAAILGPIQFVTNKLNLHRMTTKLVNKLTAIVKNPEDAEKGETFEKPLIASAATRELKKMEDVQNLEAEWAEDVAAYTEVPESVADKTTDASSESEGEAPPKMAGYQTGNRLITQKAVSESEEMRPTHIKWTPREENSKSEASEPPEPRRTIFNPDAETAQPPAKLSAPPAKDLRSARPQYTIQVGAYKTKTNASKMANTLSGKGYNTYVTPHTKDGATLFKVHVEKFDNKEQAYNLGHQLTNKENLPNFVTIVNPG